jgi:hypothetical protein
MVPTVSPMLPSSTPIPRYVHHFFSETSDIHLEFDYPGTWIFSEQKIEGTDIWIMGLGDAQLLTVPTRAPGESHGTPSDFGSITIWLIPGKPGQTPESELASHKQSYSNMHWIKVLDDYKIQIDGYEAYVLEYQVDDPEHYTSLMFAKRTYFMVENRVYEILFEVADKDRGGEFEKGYDFFLDSLKIVP